MSIITTKLHTIKTTEQKLKKNLNDAFMDLLNDYFQNDPDYLEDEVHHFSAVLQQIEKCGFASAFKDSYTMMILDSEHFDFVEKWNRKPKFEGEEDLIIEIAMKDGTTQIVKNSDLSY